MRAYVRALIREAISGSMMFTRTCCQI